MNTPDGREFLGYAKSSLAFTHALLSDESDSSSRLIGDEVKAQLRNGGGIYVQAVDGGIEGGVPPCGLIADVPDAEKESSGFSLTLPSVAERSLVEAVHALVLQLAQSNQHQTELLRVLTVIAEQNAQLIAELAEDDEEEDARMYLDGSPM